MLQAWCEKLMLNMIIWLMCACAIFVVAILGNLTYPTEHIFSMYDELSMIFKESGQELCILENTLQ